MASSWLRRRRVESWRRVAGSTYAEWIADYEIGTARTAGLIFAIGLPLAVAGMFATLLWRDGLVVLFVVLPIIGVAVAVLWFQLSRRHHSQNLPRRIADDLWMRGLAMLGVPSVDSVGLFRRWLTRNGVAPEQLEIAALTAIERDAPTRTAGRLPASLKLSIGLGLVGVVLLVDSKLLQIGLDAGGRGALVLRGPGSIRPLTMVSAFTTGVAGGIVYFAARGHRLFRLAATWQAPIVLAVGGVVAALEPSLAPVLVLGAAAFAVSVALMWAPAAGAFMRATEDVNRVIEDAVVERGGHPGLSARSSA